jgi:hypothetical protein
MDRRNSPASPIVAELLAVAAPVEVSRNFQVPVTYESGVSLNDP